MRRPLSSICFFCPKEFEVLCDFGQLLLQREVQHRPLEGCSCRGTGVLGSHRLPIWRAVVLFPSLGLTVKDGTPRYGYTEA